MEIQFFCQRHALSTSFDIFVVTYRVTFFLPKLVDMLLFSMEKTEFPFLVFPYFRVMPNHDPLSLNSSHEQRRLDADKRPYLRRPVRELHFSGLTRQVGRHMLDG